MVSWYPKRMKGWIGLSNRDGVADQKIDTRSHIRCSEIQGQCVSDSLTAFQSHKRLSNGLRTSSTHGSEIVPTLHVCVAEILVRATLDTCSYIR